MSGMSFLKLKSQAGLAALVAMFAGSLALNVQQAWQLKGYQMQDGPKQPVVGAKLKDLRVWRVGSKERSTLSFGDRPRVVYFLSPSCAWCKKNQANVAALANSLSFGGKFEVIGLVAAVYRDQGLESMDAYLVEHPLPFAVYVSDDVDWFDNTGFNTTPLTVATVSGAVDQAWIGGWTPVEMRSIEGFFRLKLPLPGMPAG